MKTQTFSQLFHYFLLIASVILFCDQPSLGTTNDALVTPNQLVLELSKSTIATGDRHLIVLSNAEGKILFHKLILTPDHEDGFSGIILHPPKPSFVTIATESDIIYVDSLRGRTTTRKYSVIKQIETFQTSSDTLIISRKIKTNRRRNYKEVNLQIKGVEKFHEQINYSEFYASKLKVYGAKKNHIIHRGIRGKKGLKLHFLCNLSTDLFILLRCNNESSYKYIYMPKNEIPDRATLDWHDLGTDLEESLIDLPDLGKWSVSLLAKDGESESYTTLYTELLQKERDAIPILLPFYYPFNSYKLTAEKTDPTSGTTYRYETSTSELPFVEPINYNLLKFNKVRENEYDISIRNVDKKTSGKLIFYLFNDKVGSRRGFDKANPYNSYFAKNQITNSLRNQRSYIYFHENASKWTINFNPLDGNFQFNLPDIQEFIDNYFISQTQLGTHEQSHLELSYSIDNNTKVFATSEVSFYDY